MLLAPSLAGAHFCFLLGLFNILLTHCLRFKYLNIHVELVVPF